MPKWTLLIWIPIFLFAAYKYVQHERAAGSYLGNSFKGVQITLKYAQMGVIGLVVLLVLFAILTRT